MAWLTVPPSSSAYPSDALDRARWLAAAAVVLLHCAAYPLQHTLEFGTPAWYWANLYDAAARWCVPVFVMISGALLLDPQRPVDLPQFYRKRARRILPPLLCWSAFYLLWTVLMHIWQQQPWTWPAIWGKLARGAPYYHLWYLYMIVGLYACAPFLQQCYARSSPQARSGATLAILGAAAANAAYRHFVPGERPDFFFNAFLPYVGMFLAGRLIYTRSWQLPRPGHVLLACILISTAGVGLMSQPGALNFYFYDAFHPVVILMSVAAFQWLLETRALPRLSVLAPLTFGVYLLHPVFLDLARYSGWYAPQHHAVWQIPMTSALIVLLSLTSVWLLRHWSALRRLT